MDMPGKDVEQIDYVASALGLQAVELVEQAKRKQAEYADLLTLEGALNIIASQRGVAIKKQERAPVLLPVLPLGGKVSGVIRFHGHTQPRTFKNERGEGSVLNIYGQAEGQVCLVLWNRDCHRFASMNFRKNDFLLVKNAVVKKQEPYELHCVFNSVFSKIEPSPAWAGAALAESNRAKLVGLKPTEKLIDSECTLVQVGETREFKKQNGTGKMCRGELSQEGSKVNLVAWGGACDLLAGLRPPCVVELENVAVKSNKFGELELHTVDTSRVIHMRDASDEFELTTISKLKDGQVCRITGKPSALQVKIIHRCPKCATTVKQAKCPTCNVDSQELLIAEVKLTDQTGSINCTFFNRVALELLGVRSISPDIIDAVVELKPMPKNPEVLVATKHSSYLGTKTATCRKIISREKN